MNVVVFLGPTLSRELARARLDATYLPPASHGDVYRAARDRPFAIGLVDGYFEHVPAVWHKEILWAISQGIHVFGAASIGALRASELSRFGMKGVGKVYAVFECGALEDDDEVAVVHGDESTGYRATSEAMVNIRATVGRALSEAALSIDSSRILLELAKRAFYPDRTYPYLLERAVNAGVPAGELETFRAFLSFGRMDVKREDACELLEVMRTFEQEGAPPSPPKFSFSRTDRWNELVDWAESQPPLRLGAGTLADDRVAAEARLDSGGASMVAAARVRAAASELARYEPSPGADGIEQDVASAERLPESAFEDWLRDSGLSECSYGAFLERQSAVERFRARTKLDLDRHIVDEARWTASYSRLSARARHKEAVLASHGMLQPTLADAGLSREELTVWCLERSLGRKVRGDLGRWIDALGFADEVAFQREALREFFYLKFKQGVFHQHGSSSGTLG